MQPKPGAPEWFGLSPVIWLIFAGAAALGLFVVWENRRIARGEGALIDPGDAAQHPAARRGHARSSSCSWSMAGLFFAIPLFLSISLGLSAIETGVRLLPLSLSLLLFSAGIPRLLPDVSPRRVVRLGFVGLFAGLVLLVGLLDIGAGPEIVTWPLLLAGAGLGAMASQLGAVTVSSVPDEQSGQVGGLQNTGTQLGSSIGTALAGALLISALTASFFTGIQNNPDVPRGRRLAGADQARRRRPVHLRRRSRGGAVGCGRFRDDRGRDRRDERPEPDRRPAGRYRSPGAARSARTPVHPWDPDDAARRCRGEGRAGTESGARVRRSLYAGGLLLLPFSLESISERQPLSLG